MMANQPHWVLIRPFVDGPTVERVKLMHPALPKLLELQEMDQRSAELQAQLNRYPKAWEEVKKDLQKLTDELKVAQDAEAVTVREIKLLKQQQAIYNDRLKKSGDQQMLVKNTRELQAVEHQVSTLNQDLQRIQERLDYLNLVEEEQVAAVLKLNESLEKLKKTAVAERERIRKLVNQKTKELELLKTDRTKVLGKIEPDHLKLYDSVRKRTPENPLVHVKQGSCGGCYFTVLAGNLVEVHRGKEIVRCTNCGRILTEDLDFSNG